MWKESRSEEHLYPRRRKRQNGENSIIMSIMISAHIKSLHWSNQREYS